MTLQIGSVLINKYSLMRFFKVRKRRRSSVTKHYLTYKEQARTLVHERLNHYNEHYGFAYNRVAIRNQRRCWGSCTSLKNLNFSYKILFLPTELQDYIIVHELCHLEQLNHSENFWNLVEQTIPTWLELKSDLRLLERSGQMLS